MRLSTPSLCNPHYEGNPQGVIPDRFRALVSLLVALSPLTTGCRNRAESAASPSATLSGLLSFVFGDPASGAGQPAYRAWLVDSTGRSVELQAAPPDSQVSRDVQRFSGVRVRVTGHFRDSGRTVFVFTRIDSAPAPR